MGEDEVMMCLLLNHISPEVVHTAGPHLDIKGCVALLWKRVPVCVGFSTTPATYMFLGKNLGVDRDAD